MPNRNEKGEIDIVFVILAGLLIGITIWQWRSSTEHNKVFQAWSGECYKLGGAVQFSGSNLVDCFVAGGPCQVNGFQKYETLNSNPRFNNLSLCKAGGDRK